MGRKIDADEQRMMDGVKKHREELLAMARKVDQANKAQENKK